MRGYGRTVNPHAHPRRVHPSPEEDPAMPTPISHRPLTAPTVRHLAALLEAATRGATIEWVSDEVTRTGTVRTVTHFDGTTTSASEDVREQYVHVTLTPSGETWLPVRDALTLIEDGALALT